MMKVVVMKWITSSDESSNDEQPAVMKVVVMKWTAGNDESSSDEMNSN